MAFESELVNMLYEALMKRREDVLDRTDTTNKELCEKCGGKCCKYCGCHFSPHDFKEITYESLKREIKKGYISIEWVALNSWNEGRGGVYILRIRNKGKAIVDNDLERNPCILLTEHGCKLDYASRPLGGKLLIPYVRKEAYNNNETLLCYSEYDIDACVMEWKEYQHILEQLVKYFSDKDYSCSI